MPGHKRQHYVPRCYLKPFSLDGGGVAINLYNIPLAQAVRNAPVKGQCARDYLYGVDPGLERALQNFEGEYARIIRELQGSTGRLTENDLSMLRSFAYLQYARTEMAMRRARMMHEGMQNAIYEGRPVTAPDLDMSDRTMMLHSMRVYWEMREFVEDLKVCIVQNETRRNFFTSDDPSIFTSRYYVQRLGTRVFGLASSGALIFMPITSRLLLMCYDGDVYTIPDKRGHYVSITSQADVLALNELQYLKAAENLYFSLWDDRDRVDREFLEISSQRPDSWCIFSVLVSDGFTDEGKRWRRATEEERKTAKETLVAASTLHPAPSKWISKLKYRSPIRTYFDGSAAGHVRKKAWLESRGRDLSGGQFG